MYGSNPSIQGQIRRFKRLGGLERGRNQEGEEEMRAASARETWLQVLNACSAPEHMAPGSTPRSVALSSAPRSVAPSSAPCVLAPRYRPRERHLGCSAVHGQAPRRQDLWRRDVLPRHHESWRRPPGSKDEFKSSRGPNVNFL